MILLRKLGGMGGGILNQYIKIGHGNILAYPFKISLSYTTLEQTLTLRNID